MSKTIDFGGGIEAIADEDGLVQDMLRFDIFKATDGNYYMDSWGVGPVAREAFPKAHNIQSILPHDMETNAALIASRAHVWAKHYE